LTINYKEIGSTVTEISKNHATDNVHYISKLWR